MSTFGRLEGKATIVTGAASGIGEATARLFADEGAQVLAVDLDIDKVAGAHEGVANIVPLGQDVSADEAADRITGMCVKEFGKLDVLFNNAGIGGGALADQMADEDWDRVQNVNLRAPFRICRAAIPYLKESSAGRIINTSSTAAIGTDWGLSAYCASKAGVAGLTRTLAFELGKFGITANHIMPGAIHTGMTGASFANEDIAAIWAKKSPMRRLGQPIDIARVALFLASDDSAFVTGQGLQADGGLMLRL